MPDITAKRWNELASKLQGEEVAADARHTAARARATRALVAFLAALVLPPAAAGAAWLVVPSNTPEVGALAVVAPVTAAYFLIRFSRLANVERAGLDRIQHDRREWKRRKPREG